jgi:hypothetical protein
MPYAAAKAALRTGSRASASISFFSFSVNLTEPLLQKILFLEQTEIPFWAIILKSKSVLQSLNQILIFDLVIKKQILTTSVHSK